MLIFVSSKLDEAKIPEIWENEEETRLSVDELKRFYKEFARKNFRQCPYLNKNTGWKIRVSAQGIGEIKKFRKREHIILARCLGTMLEDSVLYCTVPDNKNTPGIECVSYLDYRCNVNGKKYLVRLTVKKAYGDDAHFFYYYKLLPYA
jgi:hypothetical protein